jgi:hypothetical protein
LADSLTAAPDVGQETLVTLKRRFMEARDMTAEARRDCEIDDDYFHGYQWTPTERRALALRKQPDTTNNVVRQAVLGILGVLKQGRTDPKAWGRNPDDDETAGVATKVLRYLSDKTAFAEIRMEAAGDYMTKGTCAAIVEGDGSGSVPVTQIRWEEFFYDPRARRKDLKDARYMGIAKWIYADSLKRMYPDAGDVDSAIDAWGSGPLDPSFMDRPHAQNGQWYDKKLRRVMLVEMYYNDTGEWARCVFYGDKLLEEGPSPYLDLDGKPSNPIEAQSCFVDRDNNRYGVVRDMRPLQDEVNKRHSKLLHILNNRQVFAENELALNANAETVRSEAAKPDGVIPIGWKPVAMNDVAAIQIQLLETAKLDIQRLAPNPAILGRLGNEESGRAQLVRQNAGLTELAVVLGGIESWELRIYRQMWSRAKQFWKAPDYVRVTDDAGAAQYVCINQPEYGPPQIGVDPASGMPAIVKPVLGYKNALGEMDVDITLDTTPHNANMEQEQFMALVELRRNGVPIDPILLLQASSLPGKGKIIEAMQKQAEQPNPQAQMQQAAMQADVQEKQASAAHRAAQAQHLQVRTAIEAQQPQNDLFKAGVMAGMQQAQMQSDRLLAKQQMVAQSLERLANQHAPEKGAA